ncbi:energy transducer TonB [Pseudomonas endophytica]|uniref:Energy transducer TonB n=1 Tax=Pseudomonas endophytica TaxID=1563157 RepID=A0A0Q0T6A1_9PSED|nr:energy transducer TonB [Pseudomonas endophytica]KQB55471.1 energy transducer TonB [Pseudomonas endophytica]
MTLPNNLPPELSHQGVRAADRLGFALFIAALLHIAVILGITFSPEIHPPGRSLDFTLTTFKSKTPPKEADFTAPNDNQGSGTLDEKVVPKTTQVAPFNDTDIKKVTPPPAARPQEKPVVNKAAVVTTAPKPKKAPVEKQKIQSEVQAKNAVPSFDSSQLSSEISSLEAELANEQQLYAKRPKIYRMSSASTARDKGVWYKNAWTKKVETIGNLNYPEEARRKKIYGKLRLLVSINRDGSLHEVLVLESSGQPLLDQAAQRIVRLTAPFSPLTGDLGEFDRFEIIRTWRFGPGDQLSSN